MSDFSFQRARLEELLLASSSECFSVEDRDELNALLLGNADARSFAAQFLSLDAVLAESLGAREAALRSVAEKNKRSVKALRFALRQRVWSAAATAAAVVLLGIWVQSRRIAPVDHVAVSEPVGFVQSAFRTTAFNSGDAFRPGDWIRFNQGHVVVKFKSGAKLAVEGPADFQVVNNNGARMIRGRATIRVPGKIKGFTLDTPAEQIVDLGTAFGVNVATNGETSVAVFEGEVELRGQQNASRPQQLTAGKSVQVQTKSDSTVETQHEVRDYLPTWQASFGVEAIEGAMRFAEPNERAMPGKVVDSERLLIFPERESVQLPAGFVMSATEPGAYHFPRGLKQQVALHAPVTVDGYMVQFNPGQSLMPESPRRFSGTLKFDRPVVGLLFRKAMLDESDALLGLAAGDFGGVFRRGINADDEVSLSTDRRTLRVTFDVLNGVDQIRVLVESDPSAPNTN